jgi:hypothetical protein
MLAHLTISSALMGMESARARLGPRRRWRQFVGAVAIYALVLQSLLFGFAAAPAAALASVDDGFPAFELCLHGPDRGAPVPPADLPGHHGNTHCIFCFAGANHFLGQGSLPASVAQQVHFEAVSASWPANNWHVSIVSKYSVARPRGPPLSA